MYRSLASRGTLLLTSFLATLGGFAIGSTVTVDNTGLGNYTTLKEALTAYPSWRNNNNDTIEITDSAVNPHQNTDRFILPRTTSRLTIKNASGKKPVLLCSGNQQHFYNDGSDYVFEGLTFIGDAGVLHQHNGTLMVTAPMSGPARMTIRNCILTANAGSNTPFTDWETDREAGGFYFHLWVYGENYPYPSVVTVEDSVLAYTTQGAYGSIYGSGKQASGTSLTLNGTLMIDCAEAAMGFRHAFGGNGTAPNPVVTVRNSAILSPRQSCFRLGSHPQLDNVFRNLDFVFQDSVFSNTNMGSLFELDAASTFQGGSITAQRCTFYNTTDGDVFHFENNNVGCPNGVTVGDCVFYIGNSGYAIRSLPEPGGQPWQGTAAFYNDSCYFKDHAYSPNAHPSIENAWNALYSGEGPWGEDPQFCRSSLGKWVNGLGAWKSADTGLFSVSNDAFLGRGSSGSDLIGGARWGQCLDIPPAGPSGFDSYVPALLQSAEAKCVVPDSSAEWGQMRQEIMAGLQRTLGKDLPRKWPPLNAVVESSVPLQGYSIQQVSAEFWPGVRYAMQAYVPDGTGPFPGVVMNNTGRIGPREVNYQILGGGLARMGILVVGVLPLGKGVQDAAYQYNGLALLVGTSIAQEQYHTGKRALDYLLSRSDVDGTRTGITGASDGGWVSLYVGVNDGRLLAMAPGCTNYTFCGLLLPSGWSTFVSAEGNAPEVLTYRANIPTLAAVAAPKWFNFLNAKGETGRLQFIPIIDGAAHKAYTYAGVPERYMSSLSDCTHGYWPIMQIEAISWFCERFFGQRPPEGTLTLSNEHYEFDSRFQKLLVSGEVVEVIDPERLRVASLADDDGGRPAILQIIETRRRDARDYRAALAAEPARVNEELSRCLGIGDLEMDPKVVADTRSATLETESGLRVYGYWVNPATEPSQPVWLVVGPSDDRRNNPNLVSTARFDLAMREEGNLGPTLWALLMLNRPPMGMWVWDAMAAAHWLKQEDYRTVNIVGVGDAGALIAVMAGLLSEDVSKVRVEQNTIRSLDEDVLGRQVADPPYWAHRLLWVTDMPEMIDLLKSKGRWAAAETAAVEFQSY